MAHGVRPATLAVILLVVVVSAATVLADSNLSEEEKRRWRGLHNTIRENLHLPPLYWDPDVADVAQGFADDCNNAETPLDLSGYNVNFCVDQTQVDFCFDAWATEARNYDCANATCNGGWENCKHYTQIIWEETTQMGCARGPASCSLVCVYRPGGNIGVETNNGAGRAVKPYNCPQATLPPTPQPESLTVGRVFVIVVIVACLVALFLFCATFAIFKRRELAGHYATGRHVDKDKRYRPKPKDGEDSSSFSLNSFSYTS